MGKNKILIIEDNSTTRKMLRIALECENFQVFEAEEGVLVLAAVRDISNQKHLEEELRTKNEKLENQNRRIQEANRLKSEFLANMSHELRTPLNGIIGFSELMYNGKVGAMAPNHKEYLGDILTSSRHLLQLINDVLDLAKVESGKMEFHPELISLTKLIDEVRDILRTLIAQKQINLEIQIDPNMDTVILDPAKLKQVLYNYVSNALKFTEEGGHVIIRVQPDDKKHFRLEVEDNGIGIRQEDLGRLFVEFQQLDASIAKKYQGTGLGLALTRRIIEAQGGHVGVNSTFGKGSIFYAILPCTTSELISTQEQMLLNTVPVIPLKKNALRILVIEDNAQDRAIIVNILTKAGYAVETAVSGSEALRLGQERKFDAITLDLLLPDMNGWDVLRTFRSGGINQDIPAIVVTVVAEKMAGAGFVIQDFIEKPIQPAALLAALKRIKWSPHTTKSILVIDDDNHAIKLVQEMLKESGYRVISEKNGESGLKKAEQERPQVVVLDLLMPGMNGFEFLDRFRRTDIGRYTPVIVWTVKELSLEERTQLQAYSQAIVLKGSGTTETLLEELQHYLPQD